MGDDRQGGGRVCQSTRTMAGLPFLIHHLSPSEKVRINQVRASIQSRLRSGKHQRQALGLLMGHSARLECDQHAVRHAVKLMSRNGPMTDAFERWTGFRSTHRTSCTID